MSNRPEWPNDDNELPDDELQNLDDHGGPDTPAGDEHPRTPVTQQIGRVVVIVLLAVFVVFAVSNSQRVDFSWVFGETQVTQAVGTGDESGGVPLIVLLLLAFAIGALVGAALVRSLRRRRARRHATTNGER